jgi:hypothetical protein
MTMIKMNVAKLTTAALLVAALGCGEQPKNRCKVAPGVGIAKYKRKGDPTGTCAMVGMPVKGEAVGMNAFVPNPKLSSAPDTPTSLAIKPGWLGDRISQARDLATLDPALESMKPALLNYPYGSDPAPKPTDLKTTKRPYAFGQFKTVFPNDNGVCEAGDLNASDLVYPAIPAHKHPDPEDAMKTVDEPEQPATEVKYEWKKVRTIQIASSPGTQTFADLTVTRDGCSATYGVAILVPMVGCGVEKDGATVANQKLCDPNPNEESLFGSGISQGVPTKCEDISSDPMNPDQPDAMAPNFVCVPTKTAP